MINKGLPTLLLLILTGLAYNTIYAGVSKGIANSVHNLSVGGPGTVKASSESQICIFCHVGHNSSPAAPLWNRHNPGGAYIPYSSSTAAVSPGQPTGTSILCLSCHDGTIALGKLVSKQSIVNVQGGPNMPPGRLNLTKDLSDDHPVSFDYYSSQRVKPSELVSASTLTGAVKLDNSGQLQCTSCHNVHDDQFGKFLVMSPLNGELCLACHIKDGWFSSSHSISSAYWNGEAVSSHACQSCHVPHAADGKERLLRSHAEEEICFSCHNGQVAAQNIEAEFRKFSRHPVGDTTGTHNPVETAIVNTRHVECVDCHNPHATSSTGIPSGPLAMVRGVNIAGNEVNPVSNEFEVCFRCHADSFNKPLALTPRVWDDADGNNIRFEFTTSNPSYHPVLGVAADTNSPSLRGMSVLSASIIDCKDCHGNDDINGPAGPHGSRFPPLLVRQNLNRDHTPESPSAYALCYGCHNRTSILADESFPLHTTHVANTPCTACHDPHGSQLPRLINFDATIVSPNSNGVLEYISNGAGTFSGSCALSCHNYDHRPSNY